MVYAVRNFFNNFCILDDISGESAGKRRANREGECNRGVEHVSRSASATAVQNKAYFEASDERRDGREDHFDNLQTSPLKRLKPGMIKHVVRDARARLLSGTA